MIEYTLNSKKNKQPALVDKLQLSKQGFKLNYQRDITRYYLDSFDNRLYSKQHILEVDADGANLHLCWFQNNIAQSSVTLNKIPQFYNEFPIGPWKNRFQPILEMRALLIQSEIPYQQTEYVLKNKDDKIILSLRFEINQQNTAFSRIRIIPVKGYRKVLQQCTQLLKSSKFVAEKSLIYRQMVKHAQQNYPSLLLPDNFKTDDNSINACKTLLFQQYLNIKHNEKGTIDNIDSEFLHDFRIAIRKSRTAFSLLKNCFSASILSRFKAELAWLSQITSETRDLDVYLLKFPEYRQTIASSMRPFLDHLETHLMMKQQTAQQILSQTLRSKRYQNFCLDWSVFLQSTSAVNEQGKIAQKRITITAVKQIQKAYHQVLHEGRVITSDTHSEAYHDLRKTCKKLRYLLEFFRPILIKTETQSLIKSLKILQDNLGDFQDYEVQVEKIRLFSHELTNVPPETFMAIGILTEHLQAQQRQAKIVFHDCFSQFNSAPNKQRLYQIFETSQ